MRALLPTLLAKATTEAQSHRGERVSVRRAARSAAWARQSPGHPPNWMALVSVPLALAAIHAATKTP